MAIQNNSVVQSIGEKILYIEPNNINGGTGVPVPLENLCVYAELKVEYGSLHTESYSQDGQYFVLRLNINENGESNVSLYNGIQIDNSNDTFLSTEGYGNYTINTLNNAQTEELFGVESIEISYNSYAVPEVNIKFVDIKGAALHGAEELAHDKDGNLKDGNYGSSSKFLSCFFAVPYPRFELYLKGFYGKPVYYDLTCASIKSAFNSQTGNYNVDVKLVGYSFSLISDINMCSLISAPYSTYFGESYWKEQIKNGRFLVDGNKMPTLQEIVNKWHGRTNLINEEIKLETFTTNIQNNELILNDTISRVRIFINDCDLFILANNDDIYIKNEQGYHVVFGNDENVNQNSYGSDFYTEKFFKTVFGKNFVNNNVDLSISNIQSYINSTLKNFDEKIVSIINDNLLLINLLKSFVSVDANQIILDDKDAFNIDSDLYKKNNKFYKSTLLSDIYKNLIKKIESNRKEFNKYKYGLQALVNDEIVRELGFTPTLYNLSKICFAHLETFLYMFEKVKTNSTNNVVNGKNNRKFIFPKIYIESIDKNGVKTYEEDWLGSIKENSNYEEVKFVNGLISGLTEIGVQDNVNSEDNVVNSIVYTHPIDFFYEHPFINGFKKSFDANVFKKRFFKYISSSRYLSYLTSSKLYSELGKTDALIFLNNNPNGYPNIINDIIIYKFDVIKKNIKSEYYFNSIHSISLMNSFDEHFNGVEFKNKEKKCGVICDEDGKIVTIDDNMSWSSNSFEKEKYINYSTAYIIPKASERGKLYQKEETNEKYKLDLDIIYTTVEQKLNPLSITYNPINTNIAKRYKEKIGVIYNGIYVTNLLETQVSENTHTLLQINKENSTIPFFYLQFKEIVKAMYHAINRNGRYYEDSNNIKQRAINFLLTFNYYKNDTYTNDDVFEKIIDTFNTEYSNAKESIKLVPKYLFLTFCSICYVCLNVGHKGSYSFKPWVGYLSKFKTIFNKEKIQFYSKYFENWCNSVYNAYDREFKKTEYDLYVKQNIDINNGVYGYYKYDKDNDDNNVRYLNERNPIVKKITKEFFENIWYVNLTFNMLNEKKILGINCDNISEEDKNTLQTNVLTCFDNYFDGFMSVINQTFSKSVAQKMSENVKSESNSHVFNYIKLNLYRYLKQLWDRWIVTSKNDYNTWRMDDVMDGVNKRLHFIDPSYNDIGNIINCNLEKFVELIQTCKEQDDMPFLSFLSYFYGDNNCSLHNVQNFINSQSQENIENLFRAIPLSNINWDELKKFSDLIVLFSYQPAESMEDSFDINDENSLPSHMKVRKSEYHIPSFGVTYGMQNQNYFTNIDVSMNTPNVTDQSIQATFQIADENSKVGGSDSVSNIRSVGQDMYKVYSNHAYQCTVSMMGCAWIQPLMYFQLLNVPLFRGAYIIHKVTHSISPNNMNTTFVGTKVSKLSMRKLETSYYYAQREIVHREMDLYETQKVKLTNNCDYAYYSPFGIGDKSNSKYISRLLTHFDSLYLSGITYGEYYSIILCQTSDFYVNSKENLIGYMILYLHNQWIVDRNSISDSENNSSHLNWFKNKFNISGDIFKVDEIDDDMLTYYQDNKGFINDTLKNLKNCFSDPISFVQNDYFGSDCKFIDGIIKDNKDNVPYVIEINSLYFTKSNESFFNVEYNSNSSDLSIEGLIKSFNNTLEHTDSLKGIKLSSEKIVGNIVLLKTNSNIDKIVKGQVYDMILQTYSQHLSTLVWVVKNKDSGYSMWDNLLIKISDGTQFTTKVGFIKNQNTLAVETIPTHESLHIDFYTSLIKKYRIQKDSSNKYVSVNDNFNVECTNFNKLLSNNNEWHKKLLDYFNNDENIKQIKIVDCEEYFNDIVSPFDGSSDGQYVKTKIEPTDHPSYTFEGAGQTGSTELAMKNENQLWDNEKTTITDNVSLLLARNGYTPVQKAKAVGEYAKTHLNPNDKGKCATYVRLALEGAIKMNTSGHPEAASRYYNFLYYWGYSQIHYGFPSEFKGTYQDGDIIVISAIKNGEGTEVYGHIQVYYDGSWYAYKKYNTAQCYEKERLCYILRAPSTTPIISDNSGQIGGNLSVKTDTYEPSGEIIKFIKNKETFSAKSYWDVKQYSVGYGFQVNSELRSFFGINNSVKDSEITIEDGKKVDDYIKLQFKDGFIDCMGDYYKFYGQDELDALFDIYYNCGPGVFCKSGSPKMHAALKSGNKKEVMAQMDQGITQARGLRVRREQNRLWFDGKKKEVMQSLGIS
jgi:GH24 family phage-related lysozyme (muramidase)